MRKLFSVAKQIEIFKKLLLQKNQKLNLISRRNPNQNIEDLLREGKESVSCLKSFFEIKQKVLDIGSGNGFPGLLFAIFFPKSQFYLCERKRKKAEAIKWIASQCFLSNIRVLCQSAEELKPEYDIILSQASMPLIKMEILLKRILGTSSHAFIWTSEKQILQHQLSLEMENFKLSTGNRIIKLKLLGGGGN